MFSSILVQTDFFAKRFLAFIASANAKRHALREKKGVP